MIQSEATSIFPCLHTNMSMVINCCRFLSGFARAFHQFHFGSAPLPRQTYHFSSLFILFSAPEPSNKKKSLSLPLLLLTETFFTMYNKYFSILSPHLLLSEACATQSISTFPGFHAENFNATLLESSPLFILSCKQIQFHNPRRNHCVFLFLLKSSGFLWKT